MWQPSSEVNSGVGKPTSGGKASILGIPSMGLRLHRLKSHPLRWHPSCYTTDYTQTTHPRPHPRPHPQVTPLMIHLFFWFSLRSILFISNTITVSRTDRERTRTMYWQQYMTIVNIYMTTVSSHAARLRPSGINVMDNCACVDNFCASVCLTLSTFEVLQSLWMLQPGSFYCHEECSSWQ